MRASLGGSSGVSTTPQQPLIGFTKESFYKLHTSCTNYIEEAAYRRVLFSLSFFASFGVRREFKSQSMESAKFIADNPEDGDHNQYWYSKFTIDKIIEDQILQHAVGGSPSGGLTIAFLSTPSLYYSLPEELRRNSYLFDFDTGPKEKTWSTDRGYVFYDFHNPTEIPSHLLGQVDMVVIDPPFIVADVWMKYIETSKLLLKVGNDANGSPMGKVVMTLLFLDSV